MAVATSPRRGARAPYGWRWEGRKLVEDQHEQHVRWLIVHMHGLGYSLPRIAGELLTLHLPTRSGEELWPTSTLHRIVVQARPASGLEATG